MSIKIAFISAEVYPMPPIHGGAVEAQAFQLMKLLSIKNDIFSFSISNPILKTYEKNGGITYFRFKPSIITKLLMSTYKLPFKQSNSCLFWLPYSLWCSFKLSQINPDIINIYNRIQFVPIIKFFNPNARIVLHIRQLSALEYKRVWNDKVLRKLDLVIANSKFLKNRYSEKFKEFNKILHIYNGCVQEKFMPSWNKKEERIRLRQELNIAENEKVILFVGRFAENKGLHLLIEAFDLINKKNDSIKLVIVGGKIENDPRSLKYTEYINKLSRNIPKEKIRFVGKVEAGEISKFYLLSDILIVPSLVEEGLGNVAIEAMFSGVPVISSGRGGLSDLIENEKTGLNIINIEDNKCLVKTIERLIASNQMRALLAKNAYEFVVRTFTWDQVVESYLGNMKIILRKKNILFYEPSSGFGGSANALANIVKNINKERFQPSVAIKKYGPQFDRIKKVEIIKLALPEVLRIYSIIKKKQISLMHVNTNIISGVPAIIAAKIAGIPCVCHIRQTRKLIKRERFFVQWVDKFILINKQAIETFKGDIKENKISIVHDGLEIAEFNETGNSLRNEFNLDSQPVVGLVGRIVEGKGHREFILAAEQVLKSLPNAKFAIIGDAKGGPIDYQNEIIKLANDKKLANSCIFTGWRNDVKAIIADLDILVQASTTFPEGFGLTCIEAMALKKPVIATNIPGPSDIVIDGETGFLGDPGDINMMAEKILYLLNNPDIAKKMGEAGRRRVEELFDIKKNVKQVEKIYVDLMDKKYNHS